MTRTAGVLQTQKLLTLLAHLSGSVLKIFFSFLHLAYLRSISVSQDCALLIDPLVSLTCYYIKHAHFGLLYAFSNTHIVNIHMKSCKIMARNHN